MAAYPHGNPNRYRHGGCRCTLCTAANTRAINLYRMRVDAGTLRPDADAEPVRRHVQQLMRAGLGVHRIAELWNVEPASAGIPPGRVARLRDVARAKGWVSPLAWDDIDDPDETPALGVKVPRTVAVAEDPAELSRQGYADVDIAARLGIRLTSLRTMRARGRAKVGAA